MVPLDAHRKNLLHPPIEYRPELRWWLAEGLHTDETLRREIAAAHALGFGGLEFLAMDEAGIDHTRYGWGAEEWTHDSTLIAEETARLGMSVSFTSGTNWSNANLPTITPDEDAAAKELNVAIEDVAPGATREGGIPRARLDYGDEAGGFPGHRGEVHAQTLHAVVAARILERTDAGGVLDPDSIVVLTDQVVDGTLHWTAPRTDADNTRPWRLFAYWLQGTGQTASPSASVNYTVNYLDRAGVDAVIDYWEHVVLTPELRAHIAANPRAQMYMDSLELTTYGDAGLFWGNTMAEEFRARRGYAVDRWLPFLNRSVELFAPSTTYHYNAPLQHRTTLEKVRHDFVATLTDLYIENMLQPFAEFLHGHGIALRAEISYGLPFEVSRPGPAVDGIETESLEFGSQVDAYRLLSGVANLFGKQYSSETGATTRNHMLDHRFYDQIIATQLAVGCTKTVLHGWASRAGAEGTQWSGHEGMLPMFSERFDTRQPAAEFYPLWNDAIGRLQYLLRQGRPRVDVGILRTDHFVDNSSGMVFFDADGRRVPDEVAYATRWMRNRQNHWWADLGMQDAGWSYEFFDGSLLLHEEVPFAEGLVQPDGPGYQALLVYQSALDADVAARLLAWARDGLRLVLVHGATELVELNSGRYATHERAAARTPGLDGRDAELAATIAELLEQPTVAVAGSPAVTLDALRDLGVTGRAEFGTPDENVLTHLRADGEAWHLFAYHFRYEGIATTVDITLPGVGAVHRIDPWSGALRPQDGVRTEDSDETSRTIITLTLAPGEIALLTLDTTAEPADSKPAASELLAELHTWTRVIESWDAGEPDIITEDRGLGYTTTEVRPTTAVTLLDAGEGPLAPWLELDAVGPEVSGVGEYRASLSLDALPDARGGRYLLDLGSTSGGLGHVVVNGGERRGFDTSRPVVDVTEDLRTGTNEVVVRVASSLNNRLIARGYYHEIPDMMAIVEHQETTPHDVHPRPHGLIGPVRLVRRTTRPHADA